MNNLFETPQFTPENQHELVLHTLCEFIGTSTLSQGYWMQYYKSAKFSTRLHELQRILNKTLVQKESKPFTNRFGHKSQYTVYIPILTQKEYVECLETLKEKSNFVTDKI